MSRFHNRGYGKYRRHSKGRSRSKVAISKEKQEILSQVAARLLSVDQAAALLANLPKSVAGQRTLSVDVGDPNRAVAEYIKRAFPGIEEMDCKSLTIHLSKSDSLCAKVREAVRVVGIDHEARAEALRAFQEVFGSGLPRRIESDREADIILAK